MDPAASISVIVPHHNRSHLIFDAIDSIRRQTLQPLEILIVDDGSTPEHRAALDRLTDIARIIHLEKNVGASQARNEGIDRARGEYIAFLDDDDCWMLEKLELQLKILRDDPSLDAVAGAMIIYNEDGSEGLLLSHSRRDYDAKRGSRRNARDVADGADPDRSNPEVEGYGSQFPDGLGS